MARKEHSGEELPFVALMDTMTNVVGVLVIVLVMIGIGLARSVRKVLSELPPVTVEEHVTLKKEVEDTKPKQDPKKVDEENAKLQRDLKKASDELKTLDVTKDKQNIKVVDLDTLKKQLEARQKERDQRKAAVDKLLAEIDRLKARLDTTPVYQPQPATIVKLPNSRPIPDKARFERYLITGDQIFHLDMDAIQKLIATELQNARSKLQPTRSKASDGSTKFIYDQDKVVKLFEQRRQSLRNLDIAVPYNKTSTRLSVRVTPKAGQGDPIAAATQITSRFQNELRHYKGANSVVWFHVARDGFNTYLKAREICDYIGVPAGWELLTTPTYSEPIPNLEVTRIEEPKPTPVPDPNVITIAPPKKTLD